MGFEVGVVEVEVVFEDLFVLLLFLFEVLVCKLII